MGKLDNIILIALTAITIYWLSTLGYAYHQAVNAYIDARNSKAMEMLIGK